MLRARRMHALALDKDGRVAQSIAKDLIDILNGSVNRLNDCAVSSLTRRLQALAAHFVVAAPAV